MKKVLLVEDDVNLGTTMRDALRTLKLDVYYSDGKEGVIEIFHTFRPDIILLDILLNGELDGFEIANEIRKGYETPIIFITSLDGPEELRKAFKISNSDYIGKPFKMLEVILRIDKFLSTQSRFDINSFHYNLGSIQFYPDERTLQINSDRLNLNNYESAVLAVLSKNIELFVSRNDIIQLVWEVEDGKLKEGSLNNVLSNLRKYLASDPTIKLESVPKLGVRLSTIG